MFPGTPIYFLEPLRWDQTEENLVSIKSLIISKLWRTYRKDDDSTDDTSHNHERSSAKEDHQTKLSFKGDTDFP